MKHLFLLRHAEAKRDAPKGGSDLDRPLDPSGIAACAFLGRCLRDAAIEAVLCSPAARTRETLYGLAQHAAWNLGSGCPAVRYDRTIYLAGAGRIMALARAAEDRIERLLIVGHNPGIEEAALQLQGGADDARALAALRRKFPTGDLAHLVFDAWHWQQLRRGGATLRSFVTPQRLAGEEGA